GIDAAEKQVEAGADYIGDGLTGGCLDLDLGRTPDFARQREVGPRRSSSATRIRRVAISSSVGARGSMVHCGSSPSAGSGPTTRQQVPRKLPSGSIRPPMLSCSMWAGADRSFG